MSKRGTGVIALLASITRAPPSVQAAGAICDVTLSGEAAVAKTQVDGKRLTLLNWTERAK